MKKRLVGFERGKLRKHARVSGGTDCGIDRRADPRRRQAVCSERGWLTHVDTSSPSSIMSPIMHLQRLLLVGLLWGVIGIRAEPAEPRWTSLWNGTTFDGWRTWMQQPSPSSDVPGL